MSKARNAFIKGAYAGEDAVIYGKFWPNINKWYITNYEVLDASSTKSATSAVTRGAIGAALLGPVGLAAALSAKSNDVYLIAIQWRDGKRSLLELDGKYYKEFLRIMF